MSCWGLNGICVSTMKQTNELTLDDRESTPLSFFPARVQKPFLHFSNQMRKVLWIRLHNLVELGKLSGPKEDFCHSKLEIVLIQAKCFKQSLNIITNLLYKVFLCKSKKSIN